MMPERYWPKKGDYCLSNLNDGMRLVRVRCPYCKRTHNYFAHDLIQIFGDVDVDSLMHRMKCERCGPSSGTLDVDIFAPTGREAVGLKIRRLIRIEFKRVPVWKEE